MAVILLPGGGDDSADGDLKIVCTFLPVYVFALNVVGDAPGVRVELLIAPETGCPHSYSLRAGDLARIAEADIIVANGLGIEAFLDEAVRQHARGRVITISDDCDVLSRGSVGAGHEYDEEGHEEHAEHGAASRPHHAHGDVNPHVWVSPAQAIRQVSRLAEHLAEADPPRAEAYRHNAEAYVNRLGLLLKDMRDAARSFGNRNIVTFHDAFDYLARDLGLNVVASLTVDPEEAMSARQMARVIETIKETKAAAIFCEPAYSDAAAHTVAQDVGVPVFTLNPFNTIDAEPTAESYEQVMRQNLQVLREALGAAHDGGGQDGK